jgi:flagellar hook protein FlgE
MAFSFNTALSGLNANSNALGVAGNNIANSQTVGFRSNSVSFADIFADSNGVRLNGAGSSMQIGGGVRVAAIHTNLSQGNLVESGSATSAAIQGNGFFIVRNSNGEQLYTRAGDFTLDRDGHLVTPNGESVQGYAAVGGVIPPGATLGTLQVPIGQTISPTITSEAEFRMNLDLTSSVGAQFHATVQVYDSRGTSRTLDLTYTKVGAGSYQMVASVDGAAGQTSVNGAPPTATPVTFTFDSNGQLTAPTSLNVIPDQTQLGGASLPSISIALNQTNPDGSAGPGNITNYASASSISAVDQNGSAAGSFSGLVVDGAGEVFAVFSNRQSRLIGQYALADFSAQEGLVRTGNNLYSATPTSGEAVIGTPGSGGRGSIASGSLEQSNVDIAGEFVNLIQAQRGFQANSRVINTLNEALQQLFQIV